MTLRESLKPNKYKIIFSLMPIILIILLLLATIMPLLRIPFGAIILVIIFFAYIPFEPLLTPLGMIEGDYIPFPSIAGVILTAIIYCIIIYLIFSLLQYILYKIILYKIKESRNRNHEI